MSWLAPITFLDKSPMWVKYVDLPYPDLHSELAHLLHLIQTSSTRVLRLQELISIQTTVLWRRRTSHATLLRCHTHLFNELMVAREALLQKLILRAAYVAYVGRKHHQLNDIYAVTAGIRPDTLNAGNQDVGHV
ncbi:hypothetical protein Hypma_005493 [Hypsizygus marmoreus]|uniref:Uncharacterized protein n=1 Tax=Hypsizygus marmoreus TaxID=39966 RepID=A0A369K719_HYPMA|nr:hypothetical protein Hypma_005493 [Hypsizygus marmoreus]